MLRNINNRRFLALQMKVFYAEAQAVLDAASVALSGQARCRIATLQENLKQRRSLAHTMMEAYQQGSSIIDILQQGIQQY